ncbi:HD-GYP domain-containing protein [Caloramator sp. Dgby_cultured_2]|uniref:HD-GYP domain-containing protein n=1 Tax=Caloramator sp. Dgby_cultured_2 TaxID=3029174 RepID=UPI00237DE48A|nr:HD domain-containing phosphohydrolase [Caloramator sp. Dgby_cultured_2]WDU82776.1 HD domain-containing protein [Caloramator sp. Dgby_cultured_2]
MHDLGKVAISDDILNKREPLTDEEWEILKSHPEKGYRIAVSSPELAGIADLILKHHERWDGKGYPLGLKGEEIPVECRILAVVDAYDAMTNSRPYNIVKTHEEAIEEIKRCSGTQFDPKIANVFLEVFE